MDMNGTLTRRAMIRSGMMAGAVLPLAGMVVGRATAAATVPDLSPADPAANAMGYVLKTAKPGETCANCAQFAGKTGAATGRCELFPDNRVAAAGWCSSYVKKKAGT